MSPTRSRCYEKRKLDVIRMPNKDVEKGAYLGHKGLVEGRESTVDVYGVGLEEE